MFVRYIIFKFHQVMAMLSVIAIRFRTRW